MKSIFLLTFLFFAFNCFSQSQLEMNQEAYNNYQKADKELNAVYQKILVEYKSETKFLSKLKIAQKAWIQFRDAEINAQFPEEDKQLIYGSVFPMCWSMELTNLTNERIQKLKVWLEGIDEGVVCTGSIKIK
jgi:uncharacterized protein YecT (DUF1311 family)